jgi:long-chain acyl-CoA synthetase
MNLNMAVPAVNVQIPVADLNWKVVPDIWESLAGIIPNKTMLSDPVHGDKVDLTFSECNNLITTASAAMQKMNLLPGDCVSIFAENSYKWLIIDQAVMKSGSSNSVRGALAPTAELHYIYENSKSTALVVESPNLLKQLYSPVENSDSKITSIPKFVVVLFSRGMTGAELAEAAGTPPGVEILTYEELLGSAVKEDFKPVLKDPKSTATLVYTSGTTSKPKGVVLSHNNLVYQIKSNSFNKVDGQKNDPFVSDVFLSILPCWHIFERTAEYWCLARGSQMVYSNLRNFKGDLMLWKPHFLIAVPRLFETIHKGIVGNLRQQSQASAVKRKLISTLTACTQLYLRLYKTWANLLIRAKKPSAIERFASALGALFMYPIFKLADMILWSKIRQNLGGRLKVMVSGGSALPGHIESFFDMAGLRILAGYGLTETSPTLLSRVTESNVLGSVGRPPEGTEVIVVDPVTRKELPRGQSGLLVARGPGVMVGYMENDEATKNAINSDGFFDTGDLGRVNPATGDIMITGRSKDTIVLSNGENVEPQPIEDAMVGQSVLIDQAMLVGQDKNFLSAILVVNPVELAQRGLISTEKGEELNKAVGLTPMTTGPEGDVALLTAETTLIGTDTAVRNAILADLEPLFARLRPWERVQAVHLVFEPFSVPNGLMTQTLKMKRPEIMIRYEDNVDQIYTKR